MSTWKWIPTNQAVADYYFFFQCFLEEFFGFCLVECIYANQALNILDQICIDATDFQSKVQNMYLLLEISECLWTFWLSFGCVTGAWSFSIAITLHLLFYLAECEVHHHLWCCLIGLTKKWSNGSLIRPNIFSFKWLCCFSKHIVCLHDIQFLFVLHDVCTFHNLIYLIY